jgi:hypothetical protein
VRRVAVTRVVRLARVSRANKGYVVLLVQLRYAMGFAAQVNAATSSVVVSGSAATVALAVSKIRSVVRRAAA